MRRLLIERDVDCDCPWWWRWRVVHQERVPDGIAAREGVVRYHPGERTVVAHARTKLGARWKRLRLEAGGGETEPGGIVV